MKRIFQQNERGKIAGTSRARYNNPSGVRVVNTRSQLYGYNSSLRRGRGPVKEKTKQTTADK